MYRENACFHALDASSNFSQILVHAVVMILMIMKVIMMITTMSGHFIEKLVVRGREVGKMLQRIGKTHVFTPLMVSSNFSKILSVQSS